MCKALAPHGVRLARFAFAGMTAALLAGCADSRRFVGDPLGNPFKTASTDAAPTGSIEPRPAADDMPPPAYQPRTAIVSRPLAAPSDSPRRVASYEAPARAEPRVVETYAAPRAERAAAYAAPSGHGVWSGAGGMSVTAAGGETAAILAARYNVPTDALLRVNGFTSAAAIRPGTRLIIPVYNAGGARVAVAAPVVVVARPHDHPGRERLAREIADRKAVKIEAERQAAADREAAKAAEKVAAKVAVRDAERHKAAGRDGETMHWKRGPQPARLGEVDPRAQRKAEIEATRASRRAEVQDKRAVRKAEIEAQDQRKAQVEDKRALRKAAKVQAAEVRETAQAEVQAEKPRHMAKLQTVPAVAPRATHEAEAPRTAQADPTPTASLAPAEEKVASGAAGPEFRWPAHGRIIQGFKSGGNDGINIAVPDGTSVKAAESGVVAYAGNEIKGFGNLVLIRHPNGFVSAYANNGEIDVHRGEQVKRGQTIAKSGQSGNVASPQLHFELRKGSTPVDPTRYLAGL